MDRKTMDNHYNHHLIELPLWLSMKEHKYFKLHVERKSGIEIIHFGRSIRCAFAV